MSPKSRSKTSSRVDLAKSHPMDKLRAWGERLPIAYRFTAIYVGIASGWVGQLSEMVLGGPMRTCLPYHTPEECLRLLRRRRKLISLQAKVVLPPRHRNKKRVLGVL